jgi:hypothetical protein
MSRTFEPSEHSTPSYGAITGSNDFDSFGVLIADKNPSEFPWKMALSMATSGLAAALSYKKNQSIPWAVGAWLVWPVALPYYVVTGELTK